MIYSSTQDEKREPDVNREKERERERGLHVLLIFDQVIKHGK